MDSVDGNRALSFSLYLHRDNAADTDREVQLSNSWELNSISLLSPTGNWQFRTDWILRADSGVGPPIRTGACL